MSFAVRGLIVFVVGLWVSVAKSATVDEVVVGVHCDAGVRVSHYAETALRSLSKHHW